MIGKPCEHLWLRGSCVTALAPENENVLSEVIA